MYLYLNLIVNYYANKPELFKNGLNFRYPKSDARFDTNRDPPLIILLKSNHCDAKWLNLLLFGIYNCQNYREKVEMYQSDLIKAYAYCKFTIKNDRWAKMVVDYAKLTNQMFDKTRIDSLYT